MRGLSIGIHGMRMTPAIMADGSWNFERSWELRLA
ncbi:Uncharacterised protein [Mycobacteroides abscessus subsp. abscessus]|nr:Uncharacterised protein [Mycobacteroides abscessus subsp. abscessus]